MPVEPAMGAHSTATDDLAALTASCRRSLAARRSPGTARNRHRGVQAFLVWCVEDDLRAQVTFPEAYGRQIRSTNPRSRPTRRSRPG